MESVRDEATLNRLMVHGVLPDRATAGWRTTSSESFLTLAINELVMLEDYFFRGFGVPIHPFLSGLIDYFAISLCNLGLNSNFHVSIFIHFCVAYLGILPHFDLPSESRGRIWI